MFVQNHFVEPVGELLSTQVLVIESDSITQPPKVIDGEAEMPSALNNVVFPDFTSILFVVIPRELINSAVSIEFFTGVDQLKSFSSTVVS
jgi:hypothetical protein